MSDLLSQDEINALLSENTDSSENETQNSPGVSMTPQDEKALNDISSVFVSSLESVFGMLTGKEVNVTVIDSSCSNQVELISSIDDEPFVLRAKCSGLGDKPLALIMPQRGGQILSDMMMGGEGKGLSGVLSELDISAAQEGVSQVIGSAFTSLNGLIAGERLMPEDVFAKIEGKSWVLFPQNENMKICSIKLKISITDISDFDGWIVLSYDMVNAFSEALAEASKPEPAPRPQQPAAPTYQPSQQVQTQHSQPTYAGGMPGLQQPSPIVDVRPAEFSPLSAKTVSVNTSRMDLVSDIPVRVTVELGRTRKNISDILNMSAGSIIELDKMAGESVDVLVNGKLIAKGEVVVIDENFGVRVTEIISIVSKAY
ncbi:MAG: flagellar motor switch phosphatase FliY [Synergistaceae bacterium]|nr:flagellar motor switch phosphatase FliY [Synergistaceae bacterium]